MPQQKLSQPWYSYAINMDVDATASGTPSASSTYVVLVIDMAMKPLHAQV